MPAKKPTVLERLRTRRADTFKAIEKLNDKPTLFPPDQVRMEELFDDLDRLDYRIERLTPVPTVTVRNEPLTYERDREDVSFFRDLIVRRTLSKDSVAAEERLQRHAREVAIELESRDRADAARLRQWARSVDATIEERVNPNRTQGQGGFLAPPLWLLDQMATAPRTGRALANLVQNFPLPKSVSSISIPRITTGASVAPQTADGQPAASQDLVDAKVTMPIAALVGDIDLSQQLYEQAAGGNFDLVAMREMQSDYEAKLAAQLMNGTGTAGQVLGLLNVSGIGSVTWTDGSPTAAELVRLVGSAAATVATNRKLPPQVALMTGPRYFWTSSTVDTSGAVLVTPTSPTPVKLDSDVAPGTIATLPTYIDGGIPTNLGASSTEDRVVVTRPDDLLLFESVPSISAFPSPLSGTLQVRVQFRRYVAFTAELYPTSTAVIGGTGLVTPAFS